jgi:hypothetical protein
MVSNHARQTVDRVFVEASLIQNDLLAPILLGQGELLQKVRQHVCASDIEPVVAIGRSRAESQDLGAIVLNGDLHVSIRVFLRLQALESRFDLDKEAAGMRNGRFV